MPSGGSAAIASRPLSRYSRATAPSDAAHSVDSVRILKMSLKRVDIRLYRRSRTSSDVKASPAHFEFVVQCDWSGPTSPRAEKTMSMSRRNTLTTVEGDRSPVSARATGGPSKSMTANLSAAPWWEPLPNSYIIRRKWNDIAKFHSAIATELAFDPETGCRRIKTQVPKLPEPGQLHEFLLGVAATGDCAALCRISKLKEEGVEVKLTKGGKGAWEELDIMHTIYADNRLGPYFAEVSKILKEVPPSAVESSAAVKNFVTWGICNNEHSDPSKVRRRFLGPSPPVLPDAQDIQRVARLMRQKLQQKGVTDEDGQTRPASPAGTVALAERSNTTATLATQAAPSGELSLTKAKSPKGSASAPELGRILPPLAGAKRPNGKEKPPPRRCYFLRATGGFRLGGDATSPFAH
mmetsp:Transcript_59569/g.141745  ORF Transcript_59569/g.141745 Transcript_59569/m.141745 type:complete len:408 (-) Transcript_59569:42-1265(-)